MEQNSVEKRVLLDTFQKIQYLFANTGASITNLCVFHVWIVVCVEFENMGRSGTDIK